MLKIYNTLHRKKEIFKPIKKGKAGVYTCGPTVYNYAHLGNLRTYIFADILVRTLRYNKYKTKWVMNITDVGHLTSDADEGEDKLEKGALREKKSVWEIAQFYTDVFKKDIKLLNIASPDIWCKATDHIQEQIDLIKRLEKKGVIYKTSDGIYFNTSKIKDYGKLAGMDLENIQAGKRVCLREKKNPTDFALWKFSPKNKKRQMEWNSPWGIGFPGWHLECSAMSMKYLGEHFDIHTGGIDHIPVHHTNEIAQSETATGKKFVNYWMHGEFLVIDKKGKMAKSGENFIILKKIIKKRFNPLSYRYLCFLTHYRKQLQFSWEALISAQNALNNLYEKFFNLGKKIGKVDKNFQEKFITLINDDLNMPLVMALLQKVFNSNIKDENKKATVLEFDKILGLNFNKVERKTVPKIIIDLAEKRLKARKEKNWNLSDKLRDDIEKKGYIIEDIFQDKYIIKPKIN
ncbi:MAG: cysteine--tRNA ligase [Xanthomonadaceae bacterium]|nr:cysteine--tRNA ligase [Rhodospirillaceae bacterium]NIA17922.1 cysteine--tRNA ligase [Xanthomonadaceae bacterium]